MATLRTMVEMIELHQGAISHLHAAERLIEEARVLGCWEITGLHGTTSPAGLLSAVADLRKEMTAALDLIADRTPSGV